MVKIIGFKVKQEERALIIQASEIIRVKPSTMSRNATLSLAEFVLSREKDRLEYNTKGRIKLYFIYPIVLLYN